LKADPPSFRPHNDLERALMQAQTGRMGMPGFLDLFSRSDIFVPSGDAMGANGEGFQPLLFDRDGTAMVACFTAAERIGRHARIAPYCLQIEGLAFLRRLPPNVGVVVNPGHEAGFELSPSGIARIVAAPTSRA
jgi:hypothetical protein